VEKWLSARICVPAAIAEMIEVQMVVTNTYLDGSLSHAG